MSLIRPALLAALGLLCQPAMAQPAAAALPAAAPVAGTVVAIGGALRDDNDEVWRRVVQLAGGPGARFAIFATAAGDPDASAAAIARQLQLRGAVATQIRVAPRIAGIDLAQAVRDPAWIAEVRASRGVYFAGGAQERIVDTLAPGGVPTPLLEAVWEVLRSGGVVAGSSSGAAIMSETMFRDAPDVLAVLKGRLRPGQEYDRGLGFAGPGLLIDQHFLKRGRIGRLLPLMQRSGVKLGIGVEENSAVVLQGGEIEVIGARGVLLVDLAQARFGTPAVTRDAPFSLRDARLSFLASGDRHDLRSGVTTPSARKLAGTRLDPAAPGFKGYYDNEPFYPDILGDNTLVGAMCNLIDNRRAEAIGLAFSAQPAAVGPHDDAQPDLGFEFRLHKDAGSLGWLSSDNGDGDCTVVGLLLDVRPVRVSRPLYRDFDPAPAPPRR